MFGLMKILKRSSTNAALNKTSKRTVSPPLLLALCAWSGMRVTTEITKLDLIRFNFALLPRHRSTYISILGLSLFIFAFLCWLKGFPQSPNNWYALIAGSIGGSILGFLIGIIFTISNILLTSGTKNGILGEHEYTLATEGLHESTSANEGLSKWEGIVKVVVLGQYLLFQISGHLFHIIPASSFASPQEFDDYVAKSMELWSNAHNK